MIVDFFIQLFNDIISLLPGIDLKWLEYGYSSLIDHLCTVNYYFPVKELFFFIELVAAFYSARLLFGIIKWLASRIVV